MRILLTGGTGFIGSAFRNLALSHGHSIAALIRPEKRSQVAAQERLRWLPGTIAAAPWREIEEFAPDVCVHGAWIATPGVYLESPENATFAAWSRDFVTRAVASGARHIIGLGTCLEYQVKREPLSEERTPLAPTSLYARYKNQLRHELESDALTKGFSLCWARVFYPYGVGQHPARLCSALIQQIARGEVATLKTPDSTKDYIHIDDLAAALLKVVEKSFQGSINLGTGAGLTVRRIAETIGEIMNRPDLIRIESPAVADPLDYVVADSARLRSLGWQPRVTLEGGLRQLAAKINA